MHCVSSGDFHYSFNFDGNKNRFLIISQRSKLVEIDPPTILATKKISTKSKATRNTNQRCWVSVRARVLSRNNKCTSSIKTCIFSVFLINLSSFWIGFFFFTSSCRSFYVYVWVFFIKVVMHQFTACIIKQLHNSHIERGRGREMH